jgi:hypothetical protein
LTAIGAPRTLASVDGRIAARRFGLETAVFAALLVAMVPALLLHALDRALPPLSVVVAVPAGAEADAVAPVLRAAGVRRSIALGDGERAAELWSALAAAGEAPTLIEATLWPAAAVDAAALRRRLTAAAPAAVVDLRRRPLAVPAATVAVALGLAVLAAVARWRLARAVRRILRAEAATLVLIHRFGARTAWVDGHVARPIVARARRGACVGAVVGAGLGLATAAAMAPTLLRPWSGVATVVAASAAVAAVLAVGGLVRVVARTTARRLDAVASARA